MSEKVAIFLGAGASAAEGAPLQTRLFRDYFTMIKQRGLPWNSHEKEMATFFERIFDIDVHRDWLAEAVFPTFEEALGILDLANFKSQSFKGFPILNFTQDSGRINRITSSP